MDSRCPETWSVHTFIWSCPVTRGAQPLFLALVQDPCKYFKNMRTAESMDKANINFDIILFYIRFDAG